MKNGKQKLKKFFKNPFVQKGIFTLAAFLFLALVWSIAYVAVGNGYLVPSLLQTVKEGISLLGKSSFYTAFFSTLLRAFIAFSISFVLAVVFAVISYTVEAFSKFFAPILSFLRSLPTMAVLLMILLWTSARSAPVVISCLVLFPMLYSSILSALSGVDKGLLEMSEVYKVPLKDRIRKLYLPAVMPHACKEGAAALSFSLKLTVSAEVMSNTFESLGGQMQNASLYGQIPTLFALVLLSFFAGFFLECIGYAVARAVERRTR